MLGKIKNLRGALYRKLIEKKEGKTAEGKKEIIQEAIPEFAIKKSARIVEFPTTTDLLKINITYPLIEPFAYANIKWNDQTKELCYNVVEPPLSEEEKKKFGQISDTMIEMVDVHLSSIKETSKIIQYLEKQVNKIIKESGFKLTTNEYVKLMYYIYRNFVGYNDIEAFLQDPNIEDISCDGIKTPLYIIHRKYGSLKTNVSYENLDTLREFLVKLAERAGRYVSYAEPLLDGTLPDGSRISAMLAGDVATRGPTFTIRKFSEKPFSPIDQIELNTVTAEMMAYIWYLVEHGASMLVIGGVATGKTSFLNSISMFIQPEAKIVSIEDTRELRLPHEHWIAGLARAGFGIPTPTGEKYGEVSLFDLLKESFRQNPDYVIVGEVRGEETYVMFQGMSSGHPSLSTFHAGSIETMIKRLTTAPINLAPTLLESLDVVIIMTHAKEKVKSARRISEIVEIVSVDSNTDEVKTNVVFKWDPINDSYTKVGESLKIEKVTLAKGGNTEDAIKDIERRKNILLWMQKKQIKEFSEVTKIIYNYYKEPKKILEMVGETPIEEKKVQLIEKPTIMEPQGAIEIPKEERPARRVSLLDLLGMKVIREKA